MKNLENVKMLNEQEIEMVAGGMIWPGIPPLDPFNPLNENNAPVEANRPLPFPQDRRGNKAPVEANRPLPFPQDRRGSKAPVEAPHNSRIFV